MNDFPNRITVDYQILDQPVFADVNWFLKYFEPDGWLMVLRIVHTDNPESLHKRALTKLREAKLRNGNREQRVEIIEPKNSIYNKGQYAFPPNFTGLHESVSFRCSVPETLTKWPKCWCMFFLFTDWAIKDNRQSSRDTTIKLLNAWK